MKEVIVIGAGPAGMLAAGTAAEKGARVVLLEKMEKPGRKLAITGKGRCNITNLKNWEDFSLHVHPVNRYFKPAFYHFTSEDTVAFLNQHGNSDLYYLYDCSHSPKCYLRSEYFV